MFVCGVGGKPKGFVGLFGFVWLLCGQLSRRGSAKVVDLLGGGFV